MHIVSPRTRSHVHRPRRSQLGGKIHAGLAELKLLDSTCRNVRSRGAEMLVRDVDAVHLNAGRTAETAAKRDRRIPVLETKTKTGGVLNLDARLQLCQIQEVAAVDWQVLNLLLIQDTLH